MKKKNLKKNIMKKKIFKYFFVFSLVAVALPVAGFTDVTGSSGVGNTGGAYGIAWEDYDNDGHLDIWIGGEGQLYHSNGDGTFTPSDECPTGGRGGVWVDADNDGYMDLFAASNGYFYDNNGNGTFTERAFDANLMGNNLGTAVALDYNNDGYIDFFFPNGNTSPGNEIRENNGAGSFTTIDGGTIGLGTGEGNGETSVGGDVDNDGNVDLYYAAPYNPAYALLYYNSGFGTFNEDASGAGLAVDMGAESPYFAPVFGDYNNDGWLDLFLGHPSGYQSRLYLNDGDGTFTRQSSTAPDADLGNARGAAWGDYDNDGDLDLLIGVDGGPNKLFRNDGGGVFTDVSLDLGIQNDAQPTKSVSFADYDNDGDLDIYYNNEGVANALYRNDINDSSYLKVKVVGAGSGFSPRDGIGTRVELWNSDESALLAVREVSGGEGYGNSPPKIQHFGLSDSWGGGDGTYVVKAKFSSGQIVTRAAVIPVSESITIGGAVLSQTIEIIEDAGLGVSFSANPTSGQTPLSGVDLTADVFGTEIGTINYYFWCNCDSTGTDLQAVQTACGGPNLNVSNTDINPYVATDLCSYPTSGTKTAKTIVERGSSQAEGRAEIDVYSYSTGGLWGHYLDDMDSRYRYYSTLYVDEFPDTPGAGLIENINFPNFDATLQSRVGKSSDTYTSWTGSIYAPESGDYNFHVQATGDVAFYLNIGQRGDYCDSGNEISVSDSSSIPHGVIDYSRNVYMSAGWHKIRATAYVYASSTLSDSSFILKWTPPGGTEEIIPSDVLSPEDWSDEIIAIPDLSKPKEKVAYVVAGTGGRVLKTPDIGYGLYEHWKMDEVVSGTNDLPAENHCEMEANIINQSYTLAPGKLGNAFDSDGVDTYLYVGDYSDFDADNGDQISISAWFKAPDQVGDGTIIWKDSYGKGYSIVLQDDGRVRFRFRTGTSAGSVNTGSVTYQIISAGTYNNDAWHHVMGVIDRNNPTSDYMQLFIDGVSAGTVTGINSNYADIGQLSFAGEYGGNNSIDGLIDDVRIYRRVLRPEDIALLAGGSQTSPNPLRIIMDLTAEGVSESDIIKDEVWMFATEMDEDASYHRVTNTSSGAWANITPQGFYSSTGYYMGRAKAKIPSSLIALDGSGKLDLTFEMDEGQFRGDGIVLLVPYIDDSAAYTARLYVRPRWHSVYDRASPVYLFPVDLTEELTTEDIRPFFVFLNGETKITMPDKYRPNYMSYVSGDIDDGEFPPGELDIIQNIPGAVRLMPKGSMNVPAGSLVVMGAANGADGSYNDDGWTAPLTERTDGPNPSGAVLATASGIELSTIINATYTAVGSVADNLRGTGIVGIWPDSSTAVFERAGGITGTSFNFDIGPDTDNRLVVVIADDESDTVNLSSVTVDGKSCNLVVRANNPASVGNHQEMWYCDESDLGDSSGAVNVSIAGGDAGWAVHAHLYTGVSQDGPVDFGIDATSEAQATINVSGAIDGPPDIDNPYSWYPAFGREGPQIDVVSQNYMENKAPGVTTGGGNLLPFSIDPDDDWIAFQTYGARFPGDGGVYGSPESMSMFGGGLVSIESFFEELPLPEIPTGVNASSTLCETANLSWNDGLYEDYYVIQRKSTLDPIFATTTTLTQNTTFFHDISLSNMEYTYRVRACNDFDICSGWSIEVPVNPPVQSCGPLSYFILDSSNNIEVNLSGNAEDIETSTETTITVDPRYDFSNDISLSFYSSSDPVLNPPNVTYNFIDDATLIESEYSTGLKFSVTLPGDIPPGVYVILLQGDGTIYSAGVSVILYVNSITPEWKEF